MATHADILIANRDVELATFGQTGAVYQPASGPARTITVIVSPQPPDLTEKPRTAMAMVRVQAANNATIGISRAEWTNRDTLTFDPGDGRKTLRLVRPLAWDAGMATWEVSS